MNEFKSFLERMGGLHDAVVQRLLWEPEARTLRFEIEDLCSNFEGLPEYPGVVSDFVELREVEEVSFGIETNEARLNIHEFLVEPDGMDKHRASITFWPTGRITAVFRVAEFPEIKLREVGT